MAAATRRPKASRLPAQKAPRRDLAPPGVSRPARGTRADALELIFATAIRDREGFRHGVLGSPRYGKTFHLQQVVDQALARRVVDVALVHDVKRAEPQYRGTVRASVADLVARPPGPADSRAIVFHPAAGSLERPTVEEIAALGLQLARAGQRALVLPDELYHGMKGRQTWEGASFPRILREGSSQGVSSAWTTQIPQSLPTEACDLSETIALFHLQGRSARYAVDAFRLPPDAERLLGELERGECLIVSAADGWDGKVYGPR